MEGQCDYLQDPPTYKEFFDQYLLPNKPVVFGPALISSWPALARWVVRSDTSSSIDWDFLSAAYGDELVIAADCKTREFSDQKRQTRPLRDIIALWRSGSAEGNALYVKDWHLARSVYPETFYTTPGLFRDDWMNAYYSSCTDDDFRFVYVGPAGTFTPLHRDVYTSYSWSTNVCGRKRWWLFPPEQTKFLLRKGGEEHMETAFDVRNVDPHEFPHFGQARPIVLEQNDGETIFVPSGWYHQVENLTPCVSINHNWCNSVNLPSLYDSMCAKVTEVEHALEDVRELLSQNSGNSPDNCRWEHEWVQIVQDVVEKDAGWNWTTFWKMVRHALETTAQSNTMSDCKITCTQSSGASSTAHTQPLWEPPPASLTAPTTFIHARVRACVENFLRRREREVDLVDGLRDVLDAVTRIVQSS